MKPAGDPKLLNVASGTYPLPGFVNLDNSAFLNIALYVPWCRRLLSAPRQEMVTRYLELLKEYDIRLHDCRRPLRWKNETVRHILCSHFLEHVFPSEATAIVKDFFRVLEKGGTVHLVVPDLALHADTYQRRRQEGDPAAADEFVRATLLSRRHPGSRLAKLLHSWGALGLHHRWMYDGASLKHMALAAGFVPIEPDECPTKSYKWERTDDSVHFYGRKP